MASKNNYYISVALLIFIMKICIPLTESHGRLLNPPARSSAWRFDSRFPPYYNDMELFCGGAGIQWNQNGGKCSICGENYYAQPKLFEKGGSYYTGIIVKNYTRGQIIDVYVELTANHLGYFEFRICNLDGINTDATHECLDENLLSDVNDETRIKVPAGIRDLYLKLVLPEDLICKHCVFQWKYNTGNSWGINETTGEGCLGCSEKVEQFYGCSDIAIIGDGLPIQKSTVTKLTTTTTEITKETTTATTAETSTNIGTDSTTSYETSSETDFILTETVTTSTMETSTNTANIETESSISSSETSSALTESVSTTTHSKEDTISTTSTTSKPNVKCNKDGIFADYSTGCKNYYVCVYSGTTYERLLYFSCPNNLLFDDHGKFCNYSESVDCDTL